MLKSILTATLLSIAALGNDCYVLTEATVGSIGLETHNRIQNNKEELTKAFTYHTAYTLEAGTIFCDTKEVSHTWGAKRINANDTFLWIRVDAKSDKI